MQSAIVIGVAIIVHGFLVYWGCCLISSAIEKNKEKKSDT
jgi:hypothetical protein